MCFTLSLFVDVEWTTPIQPSAEFEFIYLLNSANILLFFIVYKFVYLKSKIDKNISLINGKYDIFVSIYFVLALLNIIYIIKSGQLLRDYGEGQVINNNSKEAFSPINQIFLARIPIILIYCYYKYVAKKSNNKNTIIMVLMLELIISLMTGGRKLVLIVFLGVIIILFERSKLSNKEIIRKIPIFIAAYFCLLIVRNIRIFKGDGTFIETIKNSLANLKSSINEDLVSNIVNSDLTAVQVWTYDLINKELLTLSYGKSYLHALINTIILRPFQGDVSEWQAAYKFKSIAYPNVENMGWDYTFAAESVLNFGIKLSFIPYIIAGCIFGMIDKKRISNQYYGMFMMMITSGMIVHLRTDMTATLRYISYAIVIIIIYRIFNRDYPIRVNFINDKN